MLGMEGEGFRSLMLNFNHERWCGKTTACRVISNATRSYVKTGSGQTSRQLREIERSVFRRSIAVQALRSSRVCIEESIRYARRRQTFGQPLAQHQVIRHFAPRFWPKATHTRFLPRQASCQ
jgi:alkylation response protein AidB-like acyl-CoA dehydrogenase